MKHQILKGLSLKSLKGLAAVSLLLAFQPTFAQDPAPANPIKTNKFATYNYETGQGVITLESYVKGEIEKKPFLNPSDIVLVLDVSNSMCPFNVGDSNKKETVNQRVYLFGGDKIEYLHQGTTATNDISSVTNYNANHDWKTTIAIGGTTTLRYTIQLGGTGTLYNLAYFVNGTTYGGSKWTGTTGWYYGTSTTLTQSGSGTSARWKPYTANSADDKIYTDVKLDLLENACRSLIDVINDNPPKTGTNHNISIVTYAQANTPVLNVGLTAVTSGNISTLKDYVTHMTTAGNTYAKVGLDQAITNLSGSTGRDKIILFLTDGEPNNKYADIINSAKTLKDGGAKIFSIALVADDTMNASRWNSENTRTIKSYLEFVSSLYPSASGTLSNGKSTITPGSTNTEDLPFYQWSIGADLTDAFKEIGMAIDGGADEDGLNASDGVKLTDKINNNFCVLGDVSLIKTYVANCTGKDGTELTFGTPIQVTVGTKSKVDNSRDSLAVTVNSAVTPQSIDVFGFNYSDNWCGYDANNGKYHGQKIVVEIPFKMKAPGSTTVESVATNASGSALYKNTSAIDGAAFISPTIPFTEITIQKTGLKAGESGMYIVKKDGVEITRIILTGTDDSGSMVSTKLRLLDPDAEYSVTETAWDYTYTLTSSQVDGNVFKFFSSKKDGMNNTSEKQKVNDFK